MSNIRPWTNGDQVALNTGRVPVYFDEKEVRLYDSAGTAIVLNSSRVPVYLDEKEVRLYDSAGDAITLNANSNIQIVVNELAAAISANSGAQLKTTLYDEGGIPARVDDVSESLQSVDFEVHKIHEGDHYFYNDFLTIDSGSSQDYLITTPDTTKWGYFTFNIEGTLSTEISFFEGSDKTGTTLQTVYNNNRNSANTAGLTVHKGTSGGTTDGTDIAVDGFGTSTAGGSGGDAARNHEMILQQNTKYILRIASNTNGNRLSVKLNWYEHTSIN